MAYRLLLCKKALAAFIAAMLIGTFFISSNHQFRVDLAQSSVVSAAEKSPEDALIDTALTYADYNKQEMIKARGQKYNRLWCCVFATDMAEIAGLSYAIPYSTGCSTLYNTIIKDYGAKVVTTPQKGDLVFFKCTKISNNPYMHIAIVAEAKGNKITLIHGNYSNKVAVVNNTVFEDEHGHSTSNGTVKCVYVRPAYKKTIIAVNNKNNNKVNDDSIKLQDGYKVQLVAKCNPNCAIGSSESRNFGNVKLFNKSDKNNTIWTVHKKGNYWYFTNSKGYLLDCYGTRVKSGNNIQIHKNLCDTSLFTVKYNDHYCYLMLKGTNICVDCYGYSNWKSGTNIHVWKYNSDISQQFTIVKVK